VAVEFELVSNPLLRGVLAVMGIPRDLSAVVRFYLKQTHPELELYATPLNMNPENPAMPISTPADYAAELADATGLFYTQEMPEDTKALSGGIFTVDEFVSQARLTGDQFIEQFKYVLEHFERGFLFYYFGNVDQTSHMMMRTLDPDHPAFDPEVDGRYADLIPSLYEELDRIVGYTLETMPAGTKLIVMSDHGFTSWRRAFHLNTWLMENGYLALKDPDRRDDPGYLLNVDWTRTTAYGLGLNGLYLNIRGREKNGIVDPGDREALMREIADKLLAVVDEETGEPAITKVYIAEETYKDRGYLEVGPDIQVGYAKGTRCSFESAIGEIPQTAVIVDNTEEWSGDHLMDHEAVPGILLTNEPMVREAPSLRDLGVAVLAEFGIETEFPARQHSQ
jgi:predicted AlkP superfamily phosphohydrolase/phosphomutase